MILVDAHVHIYDSFELGLFFDSAFSNFREAAGSIGVSDCFVPVLLLAEAPECDFFHRFVDCAGNAESGAPTLGNWFFKRTSERDSLVAASVDSREILLMAGRQVATREGFEVLALLTGSRFEENIPIRDLIRSVNRENGLAVIPWGFGKWQGERGRSLTDLLEEGGEIGFFLGDSGGRASFLPRPSHLRLAEEKGVRVLPGSDPLPLESEVHRAGSYGFYLPGEIPRSNPAEYLRQALSDRKSSIKVFGGLISPLRFIKNQMVINWRKKLRR